MSNLQLALELDREEDGRWIAEVVDLPGVMAYGATTLPPAHSTAF